MLVSENMVKIWWGYPACTSFPGELFEFRDQVFCDMSSTDVCLSKNICCNHCPIISVTEIII